MIRRLKLLLIGIAGSGKTAIVKRLINKEFIQNNPPTKAVDYYINMTTSASYLQYKQQIWDISGKEALIPAIIPAHLKDANAVFLVVDVTGDYKKQKAYLLNEQLISSYNESANVYLIVTKTDSNRKQQKISRIKLKMLQHELSKKLNRNVKLSRCTAKKDETKISKIFLKVTNDYDKKLHSTKTSTHEDELVQALNNYRIERDENSKDYIRTYTSTLFCGFFVNFGYSKTEKINAVTKLLAQLQQPNSQLALDQNEVGALYNGRLGSIIANYEKQGYNVKKTIRAMRARYVEPVKPNLLRCSKTH